MKTTRLFLVVLALFGTTNALAQETNWTWQNPLPQGNTLHAVHFVDAQTGWAVGEAGTIIHTADAGATWSLQASGTTLNLSDVYFVDAQAGWTTGSDIFSGHIFHTGDGGATWATQHTITSDQLLAVHFVHADTGWAVGGRTVLHTSNGGASWTAQQTGTDPNTTSLSDAFFVDAQTGWAVGSRGLILHTSNGGATWIVQDSGLGDNPPPLNALHFVDAQTGWIVGNSVILHTTDGGETWMEQEAERGLFTDVQFLDAQTGWIATNQATFEGTTIRVTTDGGATWTRIATGASGDLLGVHFTDANTGWIVGVAGEIRRTDDGGEAWAEQSSGPHEAFWDIVHSPEGFAAAIGPPQFFLYVNDSPNTGNGEWVILNPGFEPDLSGRNNSARGKGVVQLGSRDSYVNGETQRVVSMVNGKMTGHVQTAPAGGFETMLFEIETEEDFGGLDTPMPLTWWITGTNGTILHSDDGGSRGCL